jgi:hypothetical protein
MLIGVLRPKMLDLEAGVFGSFICKFKGLTAIDGCSEFGKADSTC